MTDPKNIPADLLFDLGTRFNHKINSLRNQHQQALIAALNSRPVTRPSKTDISEAESLMGQMVEEYVKRYPR